MSPKKEKDIRTPRDRTRVLLAKDDPVNPEVINKPVPTRERLINVLTKYVVDEEKEVFNIQVSRRVLDNLTPQEIKDIHEVFKGFDANSDGLLPSADVRRLLLSLGFKVSKSDVRTMMSEADLSVTNGEADFNTFLQFVIDRQGESRDSVEELEKSFKLFDVEKTGKLSSASLRALCKHYEMSLKDEELTDMVRLADKNGDGFVDKQEFVNIMLKTNLFL